jgi:hypothetical protein
MRIFIIAPLAGKILPQIDLAQAAVRKKAMAPDRRVARDASAARRMRINGS